MAHGGPALDDVPGAEGIQDVDRLGGDPVSAALVPRKVLAVQQQDARRGRLASTDSAAVAPAGPAPTTTTSHSCSPGVTLRH